MQRTCYGVAKTPGSSAAAGGGLVQHPSSECRVRDARHRRADPARTRGRGAGRRHPEGPRPRAALRRPAAAPRSQTGTTRPRATSTPQGRSRCSSPGLHRARAESPRASVTAPAEELAAVAARLSGGRTPRRGAVSQLHAHLNCGARLRPVESSQTQSARTLKAKAIAAASPSPGALGRGIGQRRHSPGTHRDTRTGPDRLRVSFPLS